MSADWYRDATIYELHVRAFQDSDGDGVGDFSGLTRRLDYLQDLGITALWLLPFYPSPLRDDGYDIADYKAVNPDYGDLRSFRRFLKEAHKRGLKVITELVVNHTSDQHPWFQRARKDVPGGRWRDFYVWSDSTERYQDARIIFQDFEPSNWTWDPVAEAYFWHRFYRHQPDLNFENPEVHAAVFDALDFWLEMGVDGLRLDAVPYLYEEDGSDCENLPATHAFLRELREHVDQNYDDRMLLGEANMWPEDAVAYFGEGDECHMNFHFPLMPRLFMSLQQEDRFPITEILQQTPEPPKDGQWALFLRNHDELTLEMVTDQERDYMYRAYAADPQMRVNLGIRRRLAPLLGNDRRKIELLNGLLMAMPGTPVVYYGDEIGMGDNVWLGDRDAVRTPMQWTGDRNAGFSSANPQQLYLPSIIDPEYHYEKVNVEAQLANPTSLLRWMRQLITLRNRHPVFGRGELRFLHPDNPKVLAFVRSDGDEDVLVVANLARTAQAAQLELGDLAGRTPVEMFGQTEFPPVGELPYLLTLGPHSFLWFTLERRHHEGPLQVREPDGPDLPEITTSDWPEVFKGRTRAALGRPLATFLQERRWFGGKGRAIQSIGLSEVVPLTRGRPGAVLAFVRVEFTEGEPMTCSLPLALAANERAEVLLAEEAHGVVATVRHRTTGEVRVVYEALWEPEVCRALAELGVRRRTVKGERGELVSAAAPPLRALVRSGELPDPKLLRTDQSNTSITYGDAAILKLFRRLEPGTNPELEVGRHLEAVGFEHVAPLWGSVEHHARRREPITVAVIQQHVEHEADMWNLALDALGRFYADVADEDPPEAGGVRATDLFALSTTPLAEDLADRLGPMAEWAELLGRRTSELHQALADDRGDAAFAAESTTGLDRRGTYQAMRSLSTRTLGLLRRRHRSLDELAPAAVDLAAEVLARDDELLERYERVRTASIDGARIRLHGDLHLGQILHTGRDVVFLDFEGEPLRSIGERRLKGPALRDVAGMLRSFHYASRAALRTELEKGTLPDHPSQRGAAAAWGDAWYRWTAARFLAGYASVTERAELMPSTEEGSSALLDALLLEKAVYELGYELENRPTWVDIPLTGILQQLGPG
jgi:maltose alpha-D-glucosyltransferase/alpha-amylase